MKIYVSTSLVPVPVRWLRALGDATGQAAAQVIAVASRKDDAGLLLAGAGAHPGILSEMRVTSMTTGPAPVPVRALVEARVISFEREAVYAYGDVSPRAVVIRIQHGQIEVVAQWVQLGYGGDVKPVRLLPAHSIPVREPAGR